MKIRIAKKILQGRSALLWKLSFRQAVNLRRAASGTKYSNLARNITHVILYGGGSQLMRKVTTERDML